MDRNTLRELYIDELRDVYDAENQLVKALPKMAKASTSEDLRSGFEEHLEQTMVHVDRLEQIFSNLGEKPSGKKCKGMQGLVSEGSEVIDGDFEADVKDAALISAAQRVEHYEIAAYGTARTYAEILGEQDAAAVLEQTLEEEKETDQKLTELAEEINVDAASGTGSGGEVLVENEEVLAEVPASDVVSKDDEVTADDIEIPGLGKARPAGA